jgi:hypothetical protein
MKLSSMMRGFTIADGVVLAILVIGGVVGLVDVASSVAPGTMVVVEVDGTAVRKLSLSQPSRTSLPVRGGALVVEVRDGRVAVTSADCPNHVCVRTGWRSHSGEVIVCVPNRVIVKILGKRQKGIHAITG